MFERFNEDARRALFFARVSASERDGDTITSEDLLSGIVIAAAGVLVRFAPQPTEVLTRRKAVEDFMVRLEDQPNWIKKEIPFSLTVKLVLERAVQEANNLAHKTVRPEHLLLGILRDENTEAWRTLDEVGVTLRDVRRILSEERASGGEK